jgi:hypothetical protein
MTQHRAAAARCGARAAVSDDLTTLPCPASHCVRAFAGNDCKTHPVGRGARNIAFVLAAVSAICTTACTDPPQATTDTVAVLDVSRLPEWQQRLLDDVRIRALFVDGHMLTPIRGMLKSLPTSGGGSGGIHLFLEVTAKRPLSHRLLSITAHLSSPKGISGCSFRIASGLDSAGYTCALVQVVAPGDEQAYREQLVGSTPRLAIDSVQAK